MIKIRKFIPIVLFISGCTLSNQNNTESDWDISILPSSVRIDPSTNKIIENRFVVLKNGSSKETNILKNNWLFNEDRAKLHGARGEYVSFQLVLTNHTTSTLKGINIEMPPFKMKTTSLLFIRNFFWNGRFR